MRSNYTDSVRTSSVILQKKISPTIIIVETTITYLPIAKMSPYKFIIILPSAKIISQKAISAKVNVVRVSCVRISAVH